MQERSRFVEEVRRGIQGYTTIDTAKMQPPVVAVDVPQDTHLLFASTNSIWSFTIPIQPGHPIDPHCQTLYISHQAFISVHYTNTLSSQTLFFIQPEQSTEPAVPGSATPGLLSSPRPFDTSVPRSPPHRPPQPVLLSDPDCAPCWAKNSARAGAAGVAFGAGAEHSAEAGEGEEAALRTGRRVG